MRCVNGKGATRLRQVSIEESNASESLLKCRKRRDDVKTERESLTQDKSRGNLFTAWTASGMKVARTQYRLLCGTWEPVAAMSREKLKWKTHESESTDARHRGGLTRSSDEVSVMGMEQRG